ncbi:Irregular chiasm C-roughest protein [Eumeta japonica]|uniref:Irregular chiasm C-roughest protein n=1 Tax=Eumeta variegata TaxID=151549 RepID=A0A4C1ZJ26_EUMVA|nr:Irregular chiasm C-roughest protein [Eumeta japonica]
MTNYKSRFRVTSRGVKPLFLLLRTRFRCTTFSIVLLAVLSCCGGYQEQKFAMEPQDQTAVVGSRVTLPCRVENKAGQLQWTKDDFGLGLHRDLSGYERYRMIGSDEEGDYSLDIRDVTLEDDAKYQCQVSSGSRASLKSAARNKHLSASCENAMETSWDPKSSRPATGKSDFNFYEDLEALLCVTIDENDEVLYCPCSHYLTCRPPSLQLRDSNYRPTLLSNY